ncbi:MAG: hypothetical protein CYPHOPRED_003634 [Cyphobasidiales sp. Tagirdzhanova-0007]|nr:MAG: hypothetical protein CYPHOPRED_003634 [Cyphobasidiales sp. Tagirdzhanova-0007]
MTAAVETTTIGVAAHGEDVSKRSGPVNKKRGICYNTTATLDIMTAIYGSGQVTFAQNWAQTPGSLPSGMTWYPELWGTKPGMQASWNGSIQSTGADILFGPNEPEPVNCGVGSCLTPDEAKTVWLQSMAPFHTENKTLVAPAVSNGDPTFNGPGPDWLASFLAECPDDTCYIDDIALHWYGPVDQIAQFKQYFTAAYSKYNKNIWITEFGFTPLDAGGDTAAINTFFTQVLPWLDQQSWISGYAFFWAGALVDGTTLNALGQAYVSA